MDFPGPSSSSSFSYSSASSSLSPSLHWWTHDVFLSFRGEDTRKGFTAHLHYALCRRNIKTYIDDNLSRGEKISPALLKAIENSRISIVILSKNYAMSPWCLDELKKIIECRTSKRQIVLPVFYDVTPTEVRHQRKSFGKALVKLKERFQDETEVRGWKEALKKVANLSGFTLLDKTEPELIQEIVQEVSKVVKPKWLNDVAKHPVEMESRVHDVHDILQSVGVNEIRILGIYGIGGVGKTNLAKEIYNSFIDQFECCCFLENVRETLKSEYGLIQLLERLICTILEDPSLKVGSVDEGIGLINGMLWSKRILLVLDDLDRSINVKKFLDGFNKFGLGSIIIITTRDEHVLTSYNVHLRYKVKELDHDKALRLFCWNAFKNENPNHDFVELTENVLRYAGGLPLALIVLGSYLRGGDNYYWRSALEKCKRIPHDHIQGILRISYDDLEENEKNIFLDIACFFTGEQVEYVKKIHHGCDFFPDIGFKELVDKSLITIDEFHRLAMHDLLRDMGKEIVRQESKESGKRSRLWFYQDVRDVLEEAKGTNEVQGMLIELPKDQDVINMEPNAFSKMPNLKILINRNAFFPSGPNYLSNELRLLDWYGYHSHSFPQNFHGKNLVHLRLDNSLFKNLGNKNFQNLKIMKFFGCEFLTKIPDVSGLRALEELDILCCDNLVEVHGSIGFHDKLISLSILKCHKLTSFPRSLKSRSLQTLCLRDCKRLRHFPEIEVEMKNLKHLDLSGTGIRELPSSVGNLTRLVQLHLFFCQDLRHLPNSVLHLQHLQKLHLSYCSSIVFSKLNELILYERPASESDGLRLAALYSTLQVLDLSGSNFVIFPEWIKRFVDLQCLRLKDCKKLKGILELPPNIEEVDVTGCMSLEKFPEVSNKFEFSTSNFHKLRSIDLSECHKMVVNPLLFEQNIEEHIHVELIFPGNKIPDWDYHVKMTPNSCVSKINIDLPYSDEIKGIITCAVVNSSRGNFRFTTPLVISYNGVCLETYIVYVRWSTSSDHVSINYFRLEKYSEGFVRGMLSGKYKAPLMKSFGVRVVRKQKEINTLQIASWSPCVNVQLSMKPCDDDDNENPEEDLDLEHGVGCSEGAIFDTLCCFVTFLAAKLQLGGCMGLIRR